MNGFVASPPSGPAKNDPGDLVAGDAFWPGLSIDRFQRELRIPDQVDEERMRAALRGGMLQVRAELRRWKEGHVATGITVLADIGSETIDGVPAAELLYARAVFHAAAAELAESHSDIAATEEGQERNEARRAAAAELRRIATHAVRDILAVSRTAIELI